ncbi:MAG: VIT1/CCC1 transporter family protein [Promethearchaeota archaeon]
MPFKKIKEIVDRCKLYAEITDLGEIARRYFVMNFFDGVLTVFGLIIGNFTIFLSGEVISSSTILIPALAVSFAIGISGISGGYLAERAERKAEINELRRAMALGTKLKLQIKEKFESPVLKLEEQNYYPNSDIEIKSPLDLPKRLIDPKEDAQQDLAFDLDSNEQPLNMKKKPTKKPSIRYSEEQEQNAEKTLAEKAQTYATNIASLINGLAPALGGIVCLIPFFFVAIPNLTTYIFCFLLMGAVLFALGGYLAKISNDSIWKYGPIMVLAGVITAILSLFLE